MAILRDLVLVFIICMLLLPSLASGLQFGSLLKKDHVAISNGETGKLSMLLWTEEDENYTVTFSIQEIPEKWNVFIIPNTLELSKSPEGPIEIINLQDRGDIRAQVVDVYLKVSSDAKGQYQVKINALAAQGESQIVVQQERQFTIYVNVDNPNNIITEKPSEPEREPENNIIESIEPERSEESTEHVSLFYYLIIILILIGAWIIYKHG